MIDIAKESYSPPNERAGFALPERIIDSHHVAKKRIKGYAKVFVDMIQHLGSSQVNTKNDTDFQSIPELLKIDDAVEIIRSIEELDKAFTKMREEIRDYPSHKSWVLDREKELPFLKPFDFHGHDTMKDELPDPKASEELPASDDSEAKVN